MSYRLPEHKRKIVQEELEAMLEMGVIEESHNVSSSPVIMVTKKDGSIRFCVDYCGGIAHTPLHPIPTSPC